MYYFLIIFLWIFAFLEFYFRETKLKNFFFYPSCIIFGMVLCFNEWSPDMLSYRFHFDNNTDELVRLTSEPFHLFLIDTIKSLGGNFRLFIFIYGVLILVPILYFIKKTTPIPAFILFLYFIIPFYPNIVQLRNFLAFSIFFFTLLFYKKKIVFYPLLLLSVLCHYSLLIVLPFLLIRKLKFFHNYKKNLVILFIGIALLSLVPKSISDPIITSVNPKYKFYLEATTTYVGTIALFLPFFFINLIVLYHYNKYKEKVDLLVPELYKKHIPLFIELINFSNYLILFQYFIRDFSRISMNLTLLSIIYLSYLIFYGYSKGFSFFQSTMMKFGLYIWVFFAFVITFLVLNNGEYLKVITQTIETNALYGR